MLQWLPSANVFVNGQRRAVRWLGSQVSGSRLNANLRVRIGVESQHSEHGCLKRIVSSNPCLRELIRAYTAHARVPHLVTGHVFIQAGLHLCRCFLDGHSLCLVFSSSLGANGIAAKPWVPDVRRRGARDAAQQSRRTQPGRCRWFPMGLCMQDDVIFT